MQNHVIGFLGRASTFEIVYEQRQHGPGRTHDGRRKVVGRKRGMHNCKLYSQVVGQFAQNYNSFLKFRMTQKPLGNYG